MRKQGNEEAKKGRGEEVKKRRSEGGEEAKGQRSEEAKKRRGQRSEGGEEAKKRGSEEARKREAGKQGSEKGERIRKAEKKRKRGGEKGCRTLSQNLNIPSESSVAKVPNLNLSKKTITLQYIHNTFMVGCCIVIN
jgi:hypothetical protein